MIWTSVNRSRVRHVLQVACTCQILDQCMILKSTIEDYGIIVSVQKVNLIKFRLQEAVPEIVFATTVFIFFY